MTKTALPSQYIVPTGLLRICAEQMRIDNVALSPVSLGFAKILSLQDTPPRFNASDIVCVLNRYGSPHYFCVVPTQKVRRSDYRRRRIDCLDLPKATQKRLREMNIRNVGQLTDCTQLQLRALMRYTPREVRHIIIALQIRGLDLRKTPKERKPRK